MASASSKEHISLKPSSRSHQPIMKYLIILSLASVAYSARLENVYLPPSSRGAAAGGAAGLQAPSGPGFGGPVSQQFQGGPNAQQFQGSRQSQGGQAQNQAEILRFDSEINEEGFHYAYETSDGTKAEQQGRVIPGATEEEGGIKVQGSYSYIGDDGQTYSVTYTADENGYHAEGAHLPTPPPIPEAILKSLQLTAGKSAAGGGQYNSQRSSYDADNAGY